MSVDLHMQAGDSGLFRIPLLLMYTDAEGVCFHIDGLDTRQAAVDSSLVLGDVMIPVQVKLFLVFQLEGWGGGSCLGKVQLFFSSLSVNACSW